MVVYCFASGVTPWPAAQLIFTLCSTLSSQTRFSVSVFRPHFVGCHTSTRESSRRCGAFVLRRLTPGDVSLLRKRQHRLRGSRCISHKLCWQPACGWTADCGRSTLVTLLRQEVVDKHGLDDLLAVWIEAVKTTHWQPDKACRARAA